MYNTVIMKMKSYLDALMREAGVTQQQLAKDLRMAPGTIAKIQRNRFDRLDTGTITSLCRYFGLESISQLIEIEWEPGEEAGAGALAD
jgi:transcriptional regulator with XRE-family HTH domain